MLLRVPKPYYRHRLYYNNIIIILLLYCLIQIISRNIQAFHQQNQKLLKNKKKVELCFKMYFVMKKKLLNVSFKN